MCTNSGIMRVARREIDAVLDGRASAVTSMSYGAADGMKSVECNSGSPSGWKGRDGRLYFSTVAGVVVVDPRSERGHRLPPPVALEQVLVDGKLAASEIMRPGVALARGSIELGPGARNVELHYAALSFVDPPGVSTRYILEGFDKRWTDAGTRRTAYYTNLPPGRYRFRVMACSGAGEACNDAGAALDIRLRPFFYETAPFRAMCGVALLAAAVGVWRLRTTQLRRRAEAFERLVGERTGELKEANLKLGELNARLASQATQDELTKVANRRQLNAMMQIEWRRMRRNGSPLAVILVDVDDFKAFNDLYGHIPGDDCLQKVAQALESSMRRATDLVARYGGEEFAILLPETDADGAHVVAERARQAVLALAIPHERSRAAVGIVTISSGVAAMVPTDDVTPKALIGTADDALYRAKKGGRNRVVTQWETSSKSSRRAPRVT
jgi:diguanylate cyclase (GGDEF)-like protein